MSRPQAVELWYERYGALIFSKCRRLLNDDALAEDATQEVFLKLLETDRLPGDAAAAAWIASVSKNLCLNLIRARGRHAIPTETLPELPVGDLEGELDSRRLARRLFADAPVETQRPALMFYVDELPQHEVAAACAVSRRTVSSRISTFSMHCRKLLGARSRELASS